MGLSPQQFRWDCPQNSFSECRNNLASCFKRAAETHRTIFVTQNGKPTTFIGNVADWEDYLEYRELVNDVAAAEAELDRGEYLTQAEAKRDALAERTAAFVALTFCSIAGR